jgi:hypothetical protein
MLHSGGKESHVKIMEVGLKVNIKKSKYMLKSHQQTEGENDFIRRVIRSSEKAGKLN